MKKEPLSTYVDPELIKQLKIRIIQTEEFKSVTEWLDAQLKDYLNKIN